MGNETAVIKALQLLEPLLCIPDTASGRSVVFDADLRSHVSFPKGNIELGESENQTAEHVILEETGLHVCVDTRFRAQNRYMIRPNVQKLVVFFAAIATESALTPQLEEISEAMWLPIDEAAKRLSYERDRKILYAAHEHIVRTAE